MLLLVFGQDDVMDHIIIKPISCSLVRINCKPIAVTAVNDPRDYAPAV
jgi:hypothetical protein